MYKTVKNILKLSFVSALLLGLSFSFSSCTSKSEDIHVDRLTGEETEMEITQPATEVSFRGNSLHTVGTLPQVGDKLPDFTLTDKEMNDKSLTDFEGNYLILNIFPSVDTKVCSMSVREFNSVAADLDNTKVLCISKDLPFAQERFCGAEGIENVVMLSDFRSDFGKVYGVEMAEGPIRGLMSRAVIVADPDGNVIYSEQVPDIGQEPDYEQALAALQQ